MAAENERYYIEPDVLREYCISLLEKVGVPRDEGFYMVDGLVMANLRGVESHGVSRMPIYMKTLSLGLIRKVADMQIENETESSMVVDGKNSLGAVIGVRVMRKLMEKARTTGTVMASVRSSTHFGMSAYYSMMALEENMIGWAISNSPKSMAPWGAVEPFTGTNPLSCAVPAGQMHPIVLDMATSVAAKGKIILALKGDGKIPEGWALDKNGLMTTDAQEAMQGTVMPVGGPKGFAISLLIDIISSGLSGGVFGPHVNNLYNTFDDAQHMCHAFGVINIEKFIPVAHFKNRIDEMIRAIKASTPATGVKEIFLPGEIEFNLQAVGQKEGIALPAVTHRELEELGKEYNVPFSLGERTTPFA